MIHGPTSRCLLLMLLSGILAACSTATNAASTSTAKGDDPLVGVWSIELSQEGKDLGFATAAFIRSGSDVARGWINLSKPTHYGVFEIRQAAPALIQVEDPPPVAAARVGPADSVEIVLNPAPDHGALVMRGRWSGDKVLGDWYLTSYALGEHGTFVMNRLR